MAEGKGASLTGHEKRVVKALFAQGMNTQTINTWINTWRTVSVNFGRISSVKKDAAQVVATQDEVDYFFAHKAAFDSETGLNRIDDERLIRAREAMVLAVQVFNSAGLKFKTEVFAMLASVAWTYLLHEYYDTKTDVEIEDEQGQSMALSHMIKLPECPLSEGVKQNLNGLKILRDKVEHHLLGKADLKWLGLFQACCLNFDKALCDLFGPRVSLSKELSFALQFASMNLAQASTLNKYDIPAHINAIDALITDGMTPEQLNNIEFQFQVIYTLGAANKTNAHIQFVKPDSAEGKEIHNVLTKKVIADDEYPIKPSEVVTKVAQKSKKHFSSHTHQQATRLYKVRQAGKSKQPENTDKEYCIYHKNFKAYTYNQAWVDKLIAAVADDEEYKKIKAVKV